MNSVIVSNLIILPEPLVRIRYAHKQQHCSLFSVNCYSSAHAILLLSPTATQRSILIAFFFFGLVALVFYAILPLWLITQTVDIPSSHRLTIDVPREVPEGRAVLAFTPAPDRKYELPDEDGLNYEGECPLCAKYRDPETGELRLKPEMMASMQEVEDMISGKIPTKWYNSAEEMWADLDKDDDD